MSTHTYGVKQGYLDEYENSGTVLSIDPACVCGDIQILLWDFTNTQPGDSVNNQIYYVRDLPAKSKGKYG